MDEHQRRIFAQMLDQLDLYGAGTITLDRLETNLRGLLGAADLLDNDVRTAFETRLAPVVYQLEVQDWAPGRFSEAALADGIERFRAWVRSMLDGPNAERL